MSRRIWRDLKGPLVPKSIINMMTSSLGLQCDPRKAPTKHLTKPPTSGKPRAYSTPPMVIHGILAPTFLQTSINIWPGLCHLMWYWSTNYACVSYDNNCLAASPVGLAPPCLPDLAPLCLVGLVPSWLASAVFVYSPEYASRDKLHILSIWTRSAAVAGMADLWCKIKLLLAQCHRIKLGLRLQLRKLRRSYNFATNRHIFNS